METSSQFFVSDDAAKPEGLLRRDGMGRVEDSRPIGVELKQIAVRRLVASAAFVVARQRPKRVSAKQDNKFPGAMVGRPATMPITSTTIKQQTKTKGTNK